MMFSVPAEPYEIDEDIVKVLNQLFILHADHEQNCSTSTVRMVGSAQANLFASVAAGICALWGPLHGGANQEVLEMLEVIQQRRRRTQEVHRAGQEEGLGLPADGLRPPRLQELRPARQGHQGRLRQGAAQAEAAGSAAGHRPPRWRRRRSRIPTSSTASSTRTSTSTAASSTGRIGIPTNMFTVMFAIGRLPGLAGPLERDGRGPEHEDRPARARSTPARPLSHYVPIEERAIAAGPAAAQRRPSAGLIQRGEQLQQGRRGALGIVARLRGWRT